jgi:hypothetical protein
MTLSVLWAGLRCRPADGAIADLISKKKPDDNGALLENAKNCGKKAKVPARKTDTGIKQRRSLTSVERLIKM